MTTDVIYPTNDDEIDQEQAKHLYENHCAIMVVENLPVGSEFGIDLSSFSTGDKFKGIKLIPPGIHFIFASSIDKTGRKNGPRCGFYHNFHATEILVKRWSPVDEDFDDNFEADESYLERYRYNLKDLDRFLGAYRFSTYKNYSELTNKLTLSILSKLNPTCGRIRAVPYFSRDGPSISSQNTRRIPRKSLMKCDNGKPTEQNLLPDLQQTLETKIRFTIIPSDHSFTNLSVPAQITKFSLDTSMKLEQTFGPDLSNLLGEFQFAFLSLILGHVYDCFEQWRTILIMVCCADAIISRHTQFFIDFTRTVMAQLAQVPEDLFVDITDQENLIRHYIDIYIQNVSGVENCKPELSDQVAQLKRLMEEKFHWMFGVDLDDEEPVVVEI